MTAWKVNADYEAVLFGNRPGPAIINQSLEFLIFFLEDKPLFSIKHYHPDYLRYVEAVAGKAPEIRSKGAWENWWGSLKHLDVEKKLNSKEFTIHFNQDSFLYSGTETLSLNPSGIYLAKNPFGMSGQNFLKFQGTEIEKLDAFTLKFGKVLIEPLFNRLHDFSHYIFSDGSEICYQNLVDENFQYKGSVLLDKKKLTLEGLSFFQKVSSDDWSKFASQKEQIINEIRKTGVKGGYSIDSYVYTEAGNFKIRAISEINYRKTMGYVAWKLSEKYSGINNWAALILSRSKEKLTFKERLQRIESLDGVMLLSPGDTRFEMFFLSAPSHEEGMKLIKGLKGLLPDCELAIKF